jgi:hypothetical protein
MSKIALSGNASGTGTFTIASPDSNSDRTLNLPDNSGTLLSNASTAGFPAGSVLQVVSVTKTDFFSTTSSSFIDVTGVSATITPSSASSKVLVMVSGGAGAGGSPNQFGYGVILRDSTQIAIGDSRGSATRCSFDLARGSDGGTEFDSNAKHFAINFLDSPSTTSAVTYKLQVKATVNTLAIGGSTNTSDGNRSNLPTIITLMEIAA